MILVPRTHTVPPELHGGTFYFVVTTLIRVLTTQNYRKLGILKKVENVKTT